MGCWNPSGSVIDAPLFGLPLVIPVCSLLLAAPAAYQGGRAGGGWGVIA
jgi:hypothetical protein